MISTASEFLALVRGVGIDPETLLIDELGRGLAKKALDQISSRIGSAGLALVGDR
jgi:ABC-type branched-subunit amino acid transport system ATPase component